MKKLLLINALILIPGLLLAQKDDSTLELPTKDGEIFFEGVVDVNPDFKKEGLYLKAREWFVNYYKSANDVLQMDDKELGKLIGKGIHPYSFVNGINTSEITLHFTVNIDVRDGKYRYQIYNFSGKNDNTSALAAFDSNPSDGTVTYDVNFNDEYQELITTGKRRKYRTKLLSGLRDEVLNIVLSLEESMKSPSDNNW